MIFFRYVIVVILTSSAIFKGNCQEEEFDYIWLGVDEQSISSSWFQENRENYVTSLPRLKTCPSVFSYGFRWETVECQDLSIGPLELQKYDFPDNYQNTQVKGLNITAEHYQDISCPRSLSQLRERGYSQVFPSLQKLTLELKDCDTLNFQGVTLDLLSIRGNLKGIKGGEFKSVEIYSNRCSRAGYLPVEGIKTQHLSTCYSLAPPPLNSIFDSLVHLEIYSSPFNSEITSSFRLEKLFDLEFKNWSGNVNRFFRFADLPTLHKLKIGTIADSINISGLPFLEYIHVQGDSLQEVRLEHLDSDSLKILIIQSLNLTNLEIGEINFDQLDVLVIDCPRLDLDFDFNELSGITEVFLNCKSYKNSTIDLENSKCLEELTVMNFQSSKKLQIRTRTDELEMFRIGLSHVDLLEWTDIEIAKRVYQPSIRLLLLSGLNKQELKSLNFPTDDLVVWSFDGACVSPALLHQTMWMNDLKVKYTQRKNIKALRKKWFIKSKINRHLYLIQYSCSE